MVGRVRGVVATVLVVSGSVLSSIFVFGAESTRPNNPDLHPTLLAGLSFLVALGAGVMLCWRHRWPLLVTGIALVPPLLLTSDAFAALAALAALAADRRDRLRWVAGAAVYLASALAVWRDAHFYPDARAFGRFVGTSTTVGLVIGVAVVAAVLTAIPLTVGALRGARAELRRREVEDQELRAEMNRRQERSRIAREMHDVLGHRLSLLSLQAGALEVTEQGAAEAARTVRATARQSLEDLRQVIGVLRDGDGFTGADPVDGPAGRVQPTLGDIPELVANARRAGLNANITILVDQAPSAPAALSMAAYRITQESLTNVLRHAPTETADLLIRGGPGVGLALEVVNALPSTPPAEPSPGSGTGLTGVSERVAVLGGNISAGPTDEGKFAVRVWLPW